jgi:subtilisin family serine protease
MEKEYIVVVKRNVDLESFDAELTATTGMGPIPNRSVEIANPRIGSKRMTHWMLTDDEADVLRGDLRVLSVEIPPDQRDDIKIVRHATQQGIFYRPTNTSDTISNSHVNWGLKRSIETTNVYGSDNVVAGNGNYNYALDGTGVDVVIQDSGIQADHPEWISTKDELIDTVQGGVATFNFVDYNYATNDIYVPYYSFSSTQNYIASKGQNPWKSGQYDGAEFLIRFVLADGLTVERTRIFGGIGTGTVTAAKNTFEISTTGTIHIEQTVEDLRLSFTTGGNSQNGVIQLWLKTGQSRLRQIDWWSAAGMIASQSTDYYRDADGHGTHVAGIAAGKTYGWAKGAHIYSQKLQGLETIDGVSDGTGTPQTDAFDLIRLWHAQKPIDPNTGEKRPTVVNMSWGYVFQTSTDPISGVHRGVSWTWGVEYTNRNNLFNGTGILPPIYGGGTITQLPQRVASVDAEIEDMIDAGIHVCIASGNNFMKVEKAGEPDYLNAVLFTGASTTNFYHRGGSPYSDEAFIVGNIDASRTAGLDWLNESSNRGPGVNIYAPGGQIMSTSSNLADESYSLLDYPVDTNFKIMSIGGTSMAAPQVAGVCALHLQVRPDLTPSQLLEKVLSDTKSVISTSGTDDDYNNLTNLMGGPNRFLYSRHGSANTWSALGTINISGGL